MIESSERESGGTSIVHNATTTTGTITHPSPVITTTTTTTTEPGESPNEKTKPLLLVAAVASAANIGGKKHHLSDGDGVDLLTKAAEETQSLADEPSASSTDSSKREEGSSTQPSKLLNNASTAPTQSPSKASMPSKHVVSHNFVQDLSMLKTSSPSSMAAAKTIIPSVPSTTVVGCLDGEVKPRSLSISETSKAAIGDNSNNNTIVTATNKLQTNGQSAVSAINNKNTKSGSLRRGKWTVEEEAYVARVIQDFNSGYLDAPAGTTLRSYLSEKLQCDPMRVKYMLVFLLLCLVHCFLLTIQSPCCCLCILYNCPDYKEIHRGGLYWQACVPSRSKEC